MKKYIIIIYTILAFLFSATESNAQKTFEEYYKLLHKGALYIDKDCTDNKCLTDGNQQKVREAIEQLRAENIYVNIIVQSHDHGIQPVRWQYEGQATPSKSFVAGTGVYFRKEIEEGESDVLYLQDIINNQLEPYGNFKLFLIHIYPGGGGLFTNTYNPNEPANTEWDLNKSITFENYAFDHLQKNSQKAYKDEVLCKLQKAFEIIGAKINKPLSEVVTCGGTDILDEKLKFDNFVFNDVKDDLNNKLLKERKALKSDYCTNLLIYRPWTIVESVKGEQKDKLDKYLEGKIFLKQHYLMMRFGDNSTTTTTNTTGGNNITKNALTFQINPVQPGVPQGAALPWLNGQYPESECFNVSKDLKADEINGVVSTFNAVKQAQINAKKINATEALDETYSYLNKLFDPKLDPAPAIQQNGFYFNNLPFPKQGAKNGVKPTFKPSDPDGVSLVTNEDQDSYKLGSFSNNVPQSTKDLCAANNIFAFGGYPTDVKVVNDLVLLTKVQAEPTTSIQYPNQLTTKKYKVVLVYCDPANGDDSYEKARTFYKNTRSNLSYDEAILMIGVWNDNGIKKKFVDFNFSPNLVIATMPGKQSFSEYGGQKKYIDKLSSICEDLIKYQLAVGKNKNLQNQQVDFYELSKKTPGPSYDNLIVLQATGNKSAVGNKGLGDEVLHQLFHGLIREGHTLNQILNWRPWADFIWDLGTTLEIHEKYWTPAYDATAIDLPGVFVGIINGLLNQYNSIYSMVVGVGQLAKTLITGDGATRAFLAGAIKFPMVAIAVMYVTAAYKIFTSNILEERYYWATWLTTDIVFKIFTGTYLSALNPAKAKMGTNDANATQEITNFTNMTERTNRLNNPNGMAGDPSKDVKSVFDHIDEFDNVSDEFNESLIERVNEVVGELDDVEYSTIQKYGKGFASLMKTFFKHNGPFKKKYEDNDNPSAPKEDGDVNSHTFSCTFKGGSCGPSPSEIKELIKSLGDKKELWDKLDELKKILDEDINTEITKRIFDYLTYLKTTNRTKVGRYEIGPNGRYRLAEEVFMHIELLTDLGNESSKFRQALLDPLKRQGMSIPELFDAWQIMHTVGSYRNNIELMKKAVAIFYVVKNYTNAAGVNSGIDLNRMAKLFNNHHNFIQMVGKKVKVLEDEDNPNVLLEEEQEIANVALQVENLVNSLTNLISSNPVGKEKFFKNFTNTMYNFIGSEYVLRTIGTKWNNVSSFELSTLSGTRIIDVVINGVHTEFKSWASFHSNYRANALKELINDISKWDEAPAIWHFDNKGSFAGTNALNYVSNNFVNYIKGSPALITQIKGLSQKSIEAFTGKKDLDTPDEKYNAVIEKLETAIGSFVKIP